MFYCQEYELNDLNNYIFSKGGFTDSLKKLAKEENVKLLNLEEIYWFYSWSSAKFIAFNVPKISSQVYWYPNFFSNKR